MVSEGIVCHNILVKCDPWVVSALPGAGVGGNAPPQQILMWGAGRLNMGFISESFDWLLALMPGANPN